MVLFLLSFLLDWLDCLLFFFAEEARFLFLLVSSTDAEEVLADARILTRERNSCSDTEESILLLADVFVDDVGLLEGGGGVHARTPTKICNERDIATNNNNRSFAIFLLGIF